MAGRIGRIMFEGKVAIVTGGATESGGDVAPARVDGAHVVALPSSPSGDRGLCREITASGGSAARSAAT